MRGSLKLLNVYEMDKSYGSAIALLNSRRRTARPSLGPTSETSKVDSMPSLNGTPSFKGVPSLVGMKGWLQQLGHSEDDVNSLNVIHVAGTKGKGSTCAFVNSFLKAHGARTGFPQKIGFYTSPHLKYVQERIQIDSQPLSESLFSKYVFEVWDGLSRSTSTPRYLQLLMLVSVHAFIRERVDVAIYETHNGGEYDATNVIEKPIVTGITTIGIDHVEQLGPSIENIAWHKAGIFKYGSPAFSTSQLPEVATVLQRRSREKDVALEFVDVNPILPLDANALKPEVQRKNSSLAIALADTFLKAKAPEKHSNLISQDVRRGVEQFSWPGRYHRIVNGNYQWFLDGAHNELSVQKAAQWFAETAPDTQRTNIQLKRILIFSQLSERDGTAILRCAAKTLQDSGLQIQYVILTTYEERQDGSIDINHCSSPPKKPFSLEIQESYVEAYKNVDPDVDIAIEPDIESALNLARQIGDGGSGMQTLVTGSLYLVGGALRLLEAST
ncbi:putative tetrahydrofolylpolyglutamate synthase [Usnea florida]